MVLLLFGDQWGMAAPYVRIACFTFVLRPFHTINLQVINALGRSVLYLILEIIKKCLGLIILIISIPFGVWWMMALGAFVLGPMGVMINAWPNRRLLGYTIGMQLCDVLPSTILCGLMAALIFPIIWLPLPGWGRLLIQIPLGAFIYFLGAWLFRLVPLCEIARMFSSIIETRFPQKIQPLVLSILARLK